MHMPIQGSYSIDTVITSILTNRENWIKKNIALWNCYQTGSDRQTDQQTANLFDRLAISRPSLPSRRLHLLQWRSPLIITLVLQPWIESWQTECCFQRQRSTWLYEATRPWSSDMIDKASELYFVSGEISETIATLQLTRLGYVLYWIDTRLSEWRGCSVPLSRLRRWEKHLLFEN